MRDLIGRVDLLVWETLASDYMGGEVSDAHRFHTDIDGARK